MPVTFGSWPATRPGVRKMPIPSVLPTITARPKPTPRMRIRPRGADDVTLWFSIVWIRSLIRVERHEHDVDRTADISGGMARPALFEFDVAVLPAIHHRLAVRRVLDFAP